MTEIPEHLLKRAQAARDRDEPASIAQPNVISDKPVVATRLVEELTAIDLGRRIRISYSNGPVVSIAEGILHAVRHDRITSVIELLSGSESYHSAVSRFSSRLDTIDITVARNHTVDFLE